MANHKFAIGEVVKVKSTKDANRLEGIVKHLTCQGATKTGGNICDRKTCKHNPKDRIWVKWPNEDLCSYTTSELQIDDDGEAAILEHVKELLDSPDPTEVTAATKSMEQIIRSRKLREQQAKELYGEEETSMTDSTPNSALEMFKVDATKAAYRVAATQINTGVRNAVLEMLRKKGSDNAQIEGISLFLDTEIGAALLSMLTGYGLQHAPMVSKDPRVQRLSTEFRVNGMAKAGNEIFDKLLGQFLPVINSALSSLPEEETKAQTETVATPKAKVSKRSNSKSGRAQKVVAPKEDEAIDVDLEEFATKEDAELLQHKVGEEARRASNGHH
jgi:hypothetical protein